MSQLNFPTWTKMVITSVNVRSEVHGADRVPAMDIGIRQTLSNSVLSELDEALRPMFYMSADSTGAQGELEGVDAVSDMPKLRSTSVGTIPIKREFVGYTFIARFGATDTDNVPIGDAKVNNFKLALKEGGSIDLSYRIQASGVDKHQIGGIGVMVQQEIECVLRAPEISAQAELDTGTNVTPIGVKSATDTFVDTHKGEDGPAAA